MEGMNYSLCRYFAQNGSTFWSESLDFDKRRYNGIYVQQIVKAHPVLDPAAFITSIYKENRELNEDVPI